MLGVFSAFGVCSAFSAVWPASLGGVIFTINQHTDTRDKSVDRGTVIVKCPMILFTYTYRGAK